MKTHLLAIGCAAVWLSGCVTDPYTGQQHLSGAVPGAAAGAAIGAGSGALSGGNDLRNAVGAYMDHQEQDLRTSLQGTGVQVQRTAENTLNLTMPNNVTFAFDKADLTTEAQNALNTVARVLNQYPQTTITVTGHTDDIGAEKYNQLLSELRAASVATYLAKTGVNASRVTQQGMGESMPKVSNNSEANRAQNRRVEMAIKADQTAGSNQPNSPQQQNYPQQGYPQQQNYPPPGSYPQQQFYPPQDGYYR